MPKIFVLRHQLAEQQAKLKLQAKGSDQSGSVTPNSDDEKYESKTPHGLHPIAYIVNPASPPLIQQTLEQPLELTNRPQIISGKVY
jgi:hypothetical protein